MSLSIDSHVFKASVQDLGPAHPAGVFTTGPVAALVEACHHYRHSVIAAVNPSRYSPNESNFNEVDAFGWETRAYGWEGSATRHVSKKLAADASQCLRSLLPKGLKSTRTRPELVCVARATPHQDWDIRFFSLVVGTLRMGAGDTGYEMGFVPVKRTSQIDPQTYDPALYQGQKFSLPLRVGSFFTFNPGRAVHWAEPCLPSDDSLLVLLQWQLSRDQDKRFRAAVTSAYDAPFVEVGDQTPQF